jgi:hypothetical protein
MGVRLEEMCFAVFLFKFYVPQIWKFQRGPGIENINIPVLP